MKLIKMTEQINIRDFIIFMLLLCSPVAVLSVYFTMFPEKSSTPLFIIIFFMSVFSSIYYLASRKRGILLTIDGSRWTVIREENKKIISVFDLAQPHYFAAAVRQGITGRHSKTMNRWIQIFLLQESNVLKIETPYLESINLKGAVYSEYAGQIKDPANTDIKSAAERKYTYNEPDQLKADSRPGCSIHGFPSFYLLSEKEELAEIFHASDNYTAANRFLSVSEQFRGPGIRFSRFKNGLFSSRKK